MTVYINGVADIGDMLRSTYDPDLDGLIALAQLVAAVCSETELANAIGAHTTPSAHHAKYTSAEADARIAIHAAIAAAHHAQGAAGLLVAIFQENPATGTMIDPENINDTQTTPTAKADAIGEYAEVDFGSYYSIYQWRQWGNTNNNGNGVWKIEYYDGSWHDWATGIATRTSASWSDFTAVSAVICSKIRLTCTTVDSGEYDSIITELEIKWV